ncbi:MAG: hypothetical protein ACPF9L_05385 [Candidatus Poseidoniaceae archaeon]
MSKQAISSKAKPKSIVIDTSPSIPATTQEITIQLQKPNENRGLKAIVGIALTIIGPSIIFQGIEDEGSCVICFLSMGLGLSLLFQSFHRSKVSAVMGVSYFIISVCLVIFTFFGLLIFALSSMF